MGVLQQIVKRRLPSSIDQSNLKQILTQMAEAINLLSVQQAQSQQAFITAQIEQIQQQVNDNLQETVNVYKQHIKQFIQETVTDSLQQLKQLLFYSLFEEVNRVDTEMGGRLKAAQAQFEELEAQFAQKISKMGESVPKISDSVKPLEQIHEEKYEAVQRSLSASAPKIQNIATNIPF